ncbi:ribosome maturation protein SBDS [Pyrus x bretschneideri]|uniref:ribosome maturation protein SBDS n=1 Tax=Pyrus x bretschneideri TaxID=225117 RepID=UPI00202F6E6A|nr:ribosome maturation protein SBDS [Pyrus x bretschneideri]XP_009368387.2 ribosome maturation protein SBDS [Pyrus x bretschneideri]
MSRSLVQPVGQKRLTNVAVVRLKKRGTRFEIACYKNKVLSWRSGVEKDLDEVLQSHTVYTNVSKGVLAKTKDLKAAFDSDDQTKICLEILDKGELQVAGKERESQLSSQFRDIATIVMQKTYNPETRRPYTISLIESLMHEIHFAVDPHKSSKKQALEVIHELQKHFPIKRSPMRLRLIVPDHEFSSLSEKLTTWNASIISKDQSGSQISTICELDPGFYRECEGLMMKLHGRYEVLALSVHAEGDTVIDQYDDHEDEPSHSLKDSSNISSLKEKECTDPDLSKKDSADPVLKLSDDLQKQSISTGSGNAAAEGKQNRCSTCNAFVGDSKQYRDHFKSEWHKHNLKRKTRQLPPLTEEECAADMEMDDYKADLRDYSF